MDKLLTLSQVSFQHTQLATYGDNQIASHTELRLQKSFPKMSWSHEERQRIVGLLEIDNVCFTWWNEVAQSPGLCFLE